MSDTLVYRSTNPDTIAAARAAIAARQAIIRRRSAFSESQGGTGFRFSRWDGSMVGLNFDGELPKGWRPQGDYAVPDLRTKLGKEYAATMAELREPKEADVIRATGMAEQAYVAIDWRERVYSPGFDSADLDADTPAVYVTWGSADVAEQVEAELDPAHGWERMPLSQWYARIEAKQAQEAAA